MATLPYSWQECRLCGGAYLLWGDPSAPLDTDETGLGERWTEWVHLDGRPYDENDSAACNTCEGFDLESMTAIQRRWGLSLPGVTLAAMSARGVVVAGTRPARPPSAVAPAAFVHAPPVPPQAAAPVTDDLTPSDGPPPSRAVPFLLSLARSIASAPRSTVETYAPREPLQASDPLVWIVVGTSAITIVAVVVGWFTNPGPVPR